MAQQMVNDVTQRNEELQKIMDKMKSTSNAINSNKIKFGADLTNDVLNLQEKVQKQEQTRQDRVNNRNNWMTDVKNKINEKLDTLKISEDKINSLKNPTINGGKLDSAGEIDISDEDLQYLKDFAEQEFVNKFTSATLAPNITIQFGDIHETADPDQVKDRIIQILEEEIAEVAEGVYN